MDKLEQAISEILDSLPGYDRQENGMFSCEIYADYRDEMDNKTAIQILRSEDPMRTFWEQLDEWYQDDQWALGDELEQTVRARLTADDGPYYNATYGPLGISYQLPENRLYYNDQRVMYLFDGHGDGASYQGNIWNDPDGAISLVVNRNDSGEITGLEEIAPEDFPYPITGNTMASGDSSISG